MHREKPHKLLQVGVIPTPATIYIWEMIRLPDCKLLAQGHDWFRIIARAEAPLPAFPTISDP